MKLLDEDGSTVLYLRARDRDALELEQSRDASIRIVCVDGEPWIEIEVRPDQDASGVRRTITQGSNRQFSVSIPPAIAHASDLVGVELDVDVDDRTIRIGPKAD